jgi:hypothetical protein
MKNIIILTLVLLNCISLTKANILDSSDTSFCSKKKSIFQELRKVLSTKRFLLASKGLAFRDSSAKLFKIVGFKLSMFIKNKDLIELDTNSGELSREMIDAIKSAPPGTKLFFEYIRCIDSAGVNRTVLPTQFTLK